MPRSRTARSSKRSRSSTCRTRSSELRRSSTSSARPERSITSPTCAGRRRRRCSRTRSSTRSRTTTGCTRSTSARAREPRSSTRKTTSSTTRGRPTVRSSFSRSMTATNGSTSARIVLDRSAALVPVAGGPSGAAARHDVVTRTKAKPLKPAPPDPALRARARKIVTRLARTYPDWGPTLEFSSPFELLVATILAAQAQDERVNLVTRALFQKYRGPADYLAVSVAELEKDVHATGFFRQKTKTLRASSQQILSDFGGVVPGTMEGLTSLHGVGRKTASIVLGNAFGVPVVSVERHVARVAGRLGLTRQKDPEQIQAGPR